MRVATNKLQDIEKFYCSELQAFYEPGEIKALFEIAAEHYLGLSRTEVVKNPHINVNQSTLIKLYDCCKDLKKNIPLQYILGEAWFYELKFRVNPRVLIPRPETEELVHIILKENKEAGSLLDVGTGSGCIPVALKKNLPFLNVFACDISKNALDVASINAMLHNTEVIFIEADILNLDTFTTTLTQNFDLIVSNPPYIKLSESETMQQHVLAHEPHLALFVEGNDAIVFYKRIIDLCKTHLNRSGKLYFELNPLTAEEVKGYAISSGVFSDISLIKDMSGKVRFLRALKF